MIYTSTDSILIDWALGFSYSSSSSSDFFPVTAMEMAETMEAAPFWAEIVKPTCKQQMPNSNVAICRNWTEVHRTSAYLHETHVCVGACMCGIVWVWVCGYVHLQMCQRISQAGGYTPNIKYYIWQMQNQPLAMINLVLYTAEDPFPVDIFGRLHSPPRWSSIGAGLGPLCPLLSSLRLPR